MSIEPEGCVHERFRPLPPYPVLGVIFDGDDTLWLTEALYDEARSQARRIVEERGLDGSAWETIQRDRDLQNVQRMGHSRRRFPTSSVEAYDVVANHADMDNGSIRQQVWRAAASVFETPAPLRADAADTLETLSNAGIRLALLTKGDEVVQQRRIKDSSLERYFSVVRIVGAKTPGSFTSCVREKLGCDTQQVVSVGNSIQSDVIPSIEAGVYAFWLPAYSWEYEQRHHELAERKAHRLRNLSEIKRFVVKDQPLR